MSLFVTILASILGFLGIVVTTLGGVYVATRNRETEKEDSALKTLENTRDEIYEARLTLKDEINANLQKELARCQLEHKLEVEELEAEITSLHLENAEKVTEIAVLKIEIDTLKGV